MFSCYPIGLTCVLRMCFLNISFDIIQEFKYFLMLSNQRKNFFYNNPSKY